MQVIDLVHNIREHGLLQPVVVYRYDTNTEAERGKKWGLVSGFRRTKAHRVLAGNAEDKQFQFIKAIERIVKDETERRILNLSENIQRENLSIVQEALAIKHLVGMGHNRKTIATRLNTSEGWVQVRTMLLSLPQPVQDEVAAGMITQSQIRDLYTVWRHESPERCIERAHDLKAAKQRGSKTARVKLQSDGTRKCIRKKGEMKQLMDHCQGTIGFGVHTKILAWCMGEIDTNELDDSLRLHAIDNAKPYVKFSN